MSLDIHGTHYPLRYLERGPKCPLRYMGLIGPWDITSVVQEAPRDIHSLPWWSYSLLPYFLAPLVEQLTFSLRWATPSLPWLSYLLARFVELLPRSLGWATHPLPWSSYLLAPLVELLTRSLGWATPSLPWLSYSLATLVELLPRSLCVVSLL